MKEVKLDKVVLNIAVGNDEAKLAKAMKLLETITGRKSIKTLAKKRLAAWKLRPGLPIGCKVTLRGKIANDVLSRILDGVDRKVPETQFTDGSFSFGIKEYIQIPTVQYQRDLGILGFDVAVAFKRAGYRIAQRKIKRGKIPKRHRVKKQEVIDYAVKNFKIKLEEQDY